MTISLNADVIKMVGACGVEEVDVLVQYLETAANLSVDVSSATTIHTALWQALLVFKPTIIGTPISSPQTDAVFRAISHHIGEARAL